MAGAERGQTGQRTSMGGRVLESTFTRNRRAGALLE